MEGVKVRDEAEQDEQAGLACAVARSRERAGLATKFAPGAEPRTSRLGEVGPYRETLRH